MSTYLIIEFKINNENYLTKLLTGELINSRFNLKIFT